MRWFRSNQPSVPSPCTSDSRSGGSDASEQRDHGFTLVEAVIAILLVGLVVSAALLALRTTTAASATDRDHANAFAWLQAASDEIYRSARVPCTSGRSAAIAAYDVAAKAAPRPPRWAGDPSATIAVTNVEYLGRFNADDQFEWDAAFCFEGGVYDESPLYTQRITITATVPEGFSKTLQMVKNED